MRILFISNYGRLYGANRSLLTLLQHFGQSPKYQVKLIIPCNGDIVSELKDVGIDYSVIPYVSQLWYYKKRTKYLVQPFLILFTLIMFPVLIYRVWSYRPDIIYSNTSAENIGIIISKLLGIKHISHIREFMDLDHSARFIGGNVAKKRYIGLSDGVIYVSKSVAKWVNMTEELPLNHIVIYNGVNINCQTTHKYKIGDVANFGIVGILDEEKGQHIAIEYFSLILPEFPNAKLHIYGDKDGVYKEKLYDLVKDLEITENVIFHGYVKNIAQIYEKLDVFLMFSRMEGFGRVTVEAMQYGIPVIGYNSGGTAEIIDHGKNGFLFSSREEFVDEVRTLLSSQRSYDEVSKQAFTDSHVGFSIDRYCSSVEDFVIQIYNS